MIKQTLLTGWNFIRLLRLVLGILIAMQALESKDLLLGFIAVVLLFQAVANTGCFGVNGCSVVSTNGKPETTDEIIVEEVKTK